MAGEERSDAPERAWADPQGLEESVPGRLFRLPLTCGRPIRIVSYWDAGPGIRFGEPSVAQIRLESSSDRSGPGSSAVFHFHWYCRHDRSVIPESLTSGWISFRVATTFERVWRCSTSAGTQD